MVTVGCKSTQIVGEQPRSENQVLNPRPPNLVLWKASIYQSLNTKEVIYFYNSYEIVLKGAISKYIDPVVEDGGFMTKDSIFYIERVIPAFTPGRVIDINRDKYGDIIQMVVKFDVKDESFKLSYMMEDYARYQEHLAQERNSRIVLNPITESGSFILKANAKIFFLGKEADVDAKINSTDDDRLLVKKTGNLSEVSSKETAKGMVGSGSTTNNSPISTQKGVEVKDKGYKSPYAPKQ